MVIQEIQNTTKGAPFHVIYDHQNRRIKKVIGSTTTHYVWQGGQVIAEHNGSTGAVIVDYIFAGSRMIAREQSGRVFFLYDRLSARATITDGQGNIQGRQSHLPFGEELNATGTTDKHRFTSYERDSETETDYAVNRGYSASVGRFNQVDRIAESVKTPQKLNRYSYVRNNPINSTDPIGLFMVTFCFWNIATVPWEDLGYNAPGYTEVLDFEGCITIDVPTGRVPEARKPCAAQLPSDPDQMAIISLIMHEHTALSRLGQNEYRRQGEDRPGHPTGPQITTTTFFREAAYFATAIRNQAEDMGVSIREAARRIAADDRQSGAANLADGAELARNALQSEDGSPPCEELKNAISVADTSLPIGPSGIRIKWWRGHHLRPGRQRPAGHYIQVGDTDFLDYDPNLPPPPPR